MHHELQHVFDFARDHRGKLKVIPAGEDQSLQVEVGGIAMVAGAQLTMHAVVEDLVVNGADQQVRTYIAPCASFRRPVQEQSANEQRRRFANQVSIGTAVNRRIAIHVAELCEQGLPHAARDIIGERRRWQQKEDGPEPRQCADGNLQARLPVDADAFRILVDPTLHLIDRFDGVALVAGKKVSLAQPRQMLVAIQLMNRFRIAVREIPHGIVVGPKSARPLDARYRIAVPVDVCVKLHGAVTQQLHAMIAERIGFGDRVPDPLRKISSHEGRQRLALFRRNIESCREGLQPRAFQRGPFEAQPVPDPLCFEQNELPQAKSDFTSGHVA